MKLIIFLKNYVLIYFLIRYNVLNLVEPYISRNGQKFNMMASMIFKTMDHTRSGFHEYLVRD